MPTRIRSPRLTCGKPSGTSSAIWKTRGRTRRNRPHRRGAEHQAPATPGAAPSEALGINLVLDSTNTVAYEAAARRKRKDAETPRCKGQNLITSSLRLCASALESI